MKSEKEILHQKIAAYKLAGMLLVIGVVCLYVVIALSDLNNYPLVRIAVCLLCVFALISGIGVLAMKTWTKWTLLLLLLSTYSVFGATHLATGETSNFVLGFLLFGLPLTAIVFWRSARRVLQDAA